MYPIKKLKQELKEQAEKIRKLRIDHKTAQREGKYSCGPFWTAREYRHKHIAYCLLRGRTMEQIERSNREGNKPDMKLVETIMKEVQNEIIRYNESGSEQITAGSPSGTCSSGVSIDAPRHDLEQRDVSLPESSKPGFFARAKEFFGIV